LGTQQLAGSDLQNAAWLRPAPFRTLNTCIDASTAWWRERGAASSGSQQSADVETRSLDPPARFGAPRREDPQSNAVFRVPDPSVPLWSFVSGVAPTLQDNQYCERREYQGRHDEADLDISERRSYGAHEHSSNRHCRRQVWSNHAGADRETRPERRAVTRQRIHPGDSNDTSHSDTQQYRPAARVKTDVRSQNREQCMREVYCKYHGGEKSGSRSLSQLLIGIFNDRQQLTNRRFRFLVLLFDVLRIHAAKFF